MQINTQRYTHQINKNEGSCYLYRSFYLELSPLPSENLLRKCETLFLGGFLKWYFYLIVMFLFLSTDGIFTTLLNNKVHNLRKKPQGARVSLPSWPLRVTVQPLHFSCPAMLFSHGFFSGTHQTRAVYFPGLQYFWTAPPPYQGRIWLYQPAAVISQSKVHI